MAKVRVIRVIYVEDQSAHDVLVTIGDSVRAQDWAEEQYPDDIAKQEARGGLYGVYLAAKRQKLPSSHLDWLEWLDLVTVEDDEAEDTDTEPLETGESGGPASAT